MYYKVTHLTLRIKPIAEVNREEFFRRILKFLGLYEYRNKFVNTGGNKQYFSTAKYKGIYIKLPFYETMQGVGFIVEITKQGFDFFNGDSDFNQRIFFNSLLDNLTHFSDVLITRIDIKSDYIPPHIQELIPSSYKNSNSTVYIGSRKSRIQGMYINKIFTYKFLEAVAEPIIDGLLCDDFEEFKCSLAVFLDNWQPHYITIYDNVTYF